MYRIIKCVYLLVKTHYFNIRFIAKMGAEVGLLLVKFLVKLLGSRLGELIGPRLKTERDLYDHSCLSVCPSVRNSLSQELLNYLFFWKFAWS